MLLSHDQYVEAIEQNAAVAHQALSDADPTAAVPSCGEWKAADLRDHISGVFAFWTYQLTRGDTSGHEFPPEVREQYVRPISDAAGDLMKVLRQAGPDQPCWNWSGGNMTSAWGARRMAHEISVHRTDAEMTLGPERFTGIDEALASDGIDELLDVFIKPTSNSNPDWPTLKLATTKGSWTLELGEKAVNVRDRPSPGAAPTQPSSDDQSGTSAGPQLLIDGRVDHVLLKLWGRDFPAGLTGNLAVLDRWKAQPIFN